MFGAEMSTIVNKTHFSLSHRTPKILFVLWQNIWAFLFLYLAIASSFLYQDELYVILHKFSLILRIWCRYCIMFDVEKGISQIVSLNLILQNIFK